MNHRRLVFGLTALIVVILAAFALATWYAIGLLQAAEQQETTDTRDLAECIVQLLLIPVDDRYELPEDELRGLCRPLTDPGPRGTPEPEPTVYVTVTPEPAPAPTATPTPTPEPTMGQQAVIPAPFRPPPPGPAPQPIAPRPQPRPAPVEPDRPGNRPPHAGQGRPDSPPGRDR